jgi:hypothetical protein
VFTLTIRKQLLLNTSKIVFLPLCLSSQALAAQPPVPRLVVTLRIVEFCNVDTPGDTTCSLGRRPIGVFIYDPAGNLAIQAMRAVPPSIECEAQYRAQHAAPELAALVLMANSLIESLGDK